MVWFKANQLDYIKKKSLINQDGLPRHLVMQKKGTHRPSSNRSNQCLCGQQEKNLLVANLNWFVLAGACFASKIYIYFKMSRHLFNFFLFKKKDLQQKLLIYAIAIITCRILYIIHSLPLLDLPSTTMQWSIFIVGMC